MKKMRAYKIGVFVTVIASLILSSSAFSEIHRDLIVRNQTNDTMVFKTCSELNKDDYFKVYPIGYIINPHTQGWLMTYGNFSFIIAPQGAGVTCEFDIKSDKSGHISPGSFRLEIPAVGPQKFTYLLPSGLAFSLMNDGESDILALKGQ